MLKLRLWLRRKWWRLIVKPYVDRIWKPEDCGDFTDIVKADRWRGVLIVTTKRGVYAVGDHMDFIDLSISQISHI